MKGIGLMLIAIYFAYLAVHNTEAKNKNIPCVLIIASMASALVGILSVIIGF